MQRRCDQCDKKKEACENPQKSQFYLKKRIRKSGVTHIHYDTACKDCRNAHERRMRSLDPSARIEAVKKWRRRQREARDRKTLEQMIVCHGLKWVKQQLDVENGNQARPSCS